MPKVFNNFLKKDTAFVIFVVLANLFLVSLVIYYGFAAWRLVNPVSPTQFAQMSFSGEGKVIAKPDIARIVFAVVSGGELLPKVQEENTFRSNRVVEFLKKNGVEERDIKTSAYNIIPQYSSSRPCPLGVICSERERLKILGYQIRSTFEVKIRVLEKAGDIIGGVVSAGANEVGSLEFTIDKEETLREEARRLAIIDAKKKAVILTKQLGVRLRRIVSFSESGFPSPVFYKAESLSFGAAIPQSPPIESGESEIKVNVSITYELR